MEYLCLGIAFLIIVFVFYAGWKAKNAEYPDIEDVYEKELEERIEKLLEKSRRRKIRPEEIQKAKDKMITIN